MKKAIFSVTESIKDLLIENDLNAPKLAQAIGVSPQAVRGWLNGSQMPKYEHLIALSDYFRCSIDFLVGRSDDGSVFHPKPCPPFYGRIRQILKQKNVTVARVEKDTAVKNTYFVYWKKGHSPSLSSLLELAEYLGETIDFLIGRED